MIHRLMYIKNKDMSKILFRNFLYMTCSLNKTTEWDFEHILLFYRILISEFTILITKTLKIKIIPSLRHHIFLTP